MFIYNNNMCACVLGVVLVVSFSYNHILYNQLLHCVRDMRANVSVCVCVCVHVFEY